MKNPNDPELVDEGKRIRTVIDEHNYYMYVAPEAVMFTCPMENTPEMLKERKTLDELALSITKARGGSWE